MECQKAERMIKMLKWNWNEKVGTWTQKVGEYETTCNLYKCNALICGIYEFTDDDDVEKYSLGLFFNDKEHLRNCLGLTKGYENIYADYEITIRIFDHCKQTQTLVTEFLKAKFNKDLHIEILNEPF